MTYWIEKQIELMLNEEDEILEPLIVLLAIVWFALKFKEAEKWDYLEAYYQQLLRLQ